MEDHQPLSEMSGPELGAFLKRELNLPEAELDVEARDSTVEIHGVVSGREECEKLERFLRRTAGLGEVTLDIAVDPQLSVRGPHDEAPGPRDNADMMPDGGYSTRRQY